MLRAAPRIDAAGSRIQQIPRHRLLIRKTRSDVHACIPRFRLTPATSERDGLCGLTMSRIVWAISRDVVGEHLRGSLPPHPWRRSSPSGPGAGRRVRQG
jgi:hypothetical protein